jgi:hypothetical protein
LRDPISKVPDTKRAGGVAQAVGPEFKPWYCKKKKKERERERGQRGLWNKEPRQNCDFAFFCSGFGGPHLLLSLSFT